MEQRIVGERLPQRLESYDSEQLGETDTQTMSKTSSAERQYQIALHWAEDGSKVSLQRYDLHGADLRMIDLGGADLHVANLSEANLEWANLSGANVTDEQLAQARSLKGATMPDGTKHE